MDKYMHEIDLIIAALDEISVKGEDNHRYILLAQQKLREMKSVMQTEKVEEVKRRAAENQQKS